MLRDLYTLDILDMHVWYASVIDLHEYYFIRDNKLGDKDYYTKTYLSYRIEDSNVGGAFSLNDSSKNPVGIDMAVYNIKAFANRVEGLSLNDTIPYSFQSKMIIDLRHHGVILDMVEYSRCKWMSHKIDTNYASLEVMLPYAFSSQRDIVEHNLLLRVFANVNAIKKPLEGGRLIIEQVDASEYIPGDPRLLRDSSNGQFGSYPSFEGDDEVD